MPWVVWWYMLQSLCWFYASYLDEDWITTCLLGSWHSAAFKIKYKTILSNFLPSSDFYLPFITIVIHTDYTRICNKHGIVKYDKKLHYTPKLLTRIFLEDDTATFPQLHARQTIELISNWQRIKLTRLLTTVNTLM